MPQTQSEVQTMLAAAGLVPNRRLGQNFLIDGNLIRKLVSAAELTPECVVLEVGAGTGSLTELLLAQAGHVVAVEIDAGFHRLLAGRLTGGERLTLLHADVLDGKHRVSGEVLAAVETAIRGLGGPFVVVANLPYNVATPLLADLLLLDCPPRHLCVTVQKEVADRITATPACHAYGPLSVLMQTAGRIRRIARVPPQAFWPRPNVQSAMLRIDLLPLGERPVDLACLSRLLHVAFAHRRKTLRYNLRPLLGDSAADALPSCLTDILTRRPEQLASSTWCALAAHLSAGS